MNEVPPDVWITGHASAFASAATGSCARDVCTPCPTSSTGFFAARIRFTAASTTGALAAWWTRR